MRGQRFGARSGRAALAAVLLLAGCSLSAGDPEDAEGFAELREQMVARQIEARGVRDPRVLAALRKVPREELVPRAQRDYAYEDRPLPIGGGQTISQPYVVAAMTEALGLRGGEKVLEVGTGSGYQAAVLAELAGSVYSIELDPELAARARADLERLGYRNVHVRVGDGYRGWPEEAPFDAIVVTAAPDHVPQPLLDQLVVGGRMVIPVGEYVQELLLVHKEEHGVRREVLMDVRFVPMRGEAEER